MIISINITGYRYKYKNKILKFNTSYFFYILVWVLIIYLVCWSVSGANVTTVSWVPMLFNVPFLRSAIAYDCICWSISSANVTTFSWGPMLFNVPIFTWRKSLWLYRDMAVGVGTGVLLVLTVRLLARERWSRFVYRSCWFSFWSWGNYCFFVFISGFGLFAGWLDGAACFG
jgi:hypothetical protein